LCALLATGFGSFSRASDSTNQITHAVANWTPPQNPNPSKILEEAEADAKAGNYANALAKHIWFYENALNYNSGLYGVRLSFALSDWVELGKAYPPALEKLKALRDEAEKNVRVDKKVRDSFVDFAAINGYLKDEAKTDDFFVWLDSNKPDAAKEIFDEARPALIKSKNYQLCGKYIKPESFFDEALNLYRENMQLSKKPKFDNGRLQAFARKKFVNDTATLIALLVVNDRKKEAKQIVDRISEEPDLPEFKAEIEKALTGEVPPPWP
jgi:tetratricopeptide (TPR) repeat protein